MAGAGCPVRAGAGDHRAGVRRRPRKGKGADAGAGSARWRAGGREGARRRPAAAAGRPPGRGGPGPGQGRAGCSLRGAPRGPPAGAGRPAAGWSRQGASRSPRRCCQACWRRCGETRRRAPPRTRPSGPGRVAMSTTGRRPPPGPRPGPAPCAAGPRPRGRPRPARLHQDPQGRPVRPVAGPGPLQGPSRSPTAVRRSKRGAKPGPPSTTRRAQRPGPHPLDPRAPPTRRIIRPGRRRGRDPATAHRARGLDGRLGAHRPRRGGGPNPGHPPSRPPAPPREERPDHHQARATRLIGVPANEARRITRNCSKDRRPWRVRGTGRDRSGPDPAPPRARAAPSVAVPPGRLRRRWTLRRPAPQPRRRSTRIRTAAGRSRGSRFNRSSPLRLRPLTHTPAS